MAQLITKLKSLPSSFSFSTSSDINLTLLTFLLYCYWVVCFVSLHFPLLGFTFLLREIHSTSQKSNERNQWIVCPGFGDFTCFHFCSYLPFLPLPLSLVISYSPLELDTIIAFWHFIFSTHFLSFLPGWLAGWMDGRMDEWMRRTGSQWIVSGSLL